MRFLINDFKKYVYIKVTNLGCVILCLYVDDILIFSSNISIIKETKYFLWNNFDIKDLREAYVIWEQGFYKVLRVFVLLLKVLRNAVFIKF